LKGDIILSPVTAMSFVFLGREPEKMVNNGGFIQKASSVRREGHFCSFSATLAFRSVPQTSRNNAVFLPEKSYAFSKTYVSSST